MEEKEYRARIGENKVLVFRPDLERESDLQFAREFEQAAASQPNSLQEFLIRLVEIQKEPTRQNMAIMEIELKNIKIAQHLSEETTAFTGDLFVNSKKIAFVKNGGTGGNTGYQLYDINDRDLLRQAEDHCRNLPPVAYPNPGSSGEALQIPMSLEHYIDKLLDAYRQRKDIEKHQRNSVLVGISGEYYHQLKFAKPIAAILKLPNGIELIKKAMQEKIIPVLKDGESILNTNLPPELMKLEKKKVPRPRIPKGDQNSKRTGPRQ